MNNTTIGLVIIIVVVIGGFYLFTSSQENNRATTHSTEKESQDTHGNGEEHSPVSEEVGVDVVPLPSNSLTGVWQSIDDQKFIRTIYENGGYTDTYVGDPDAAENGPWVTFTKNNAPDSFPFPLEENVTYLRLSGSVTLDYKVVEISEKRLTLIYLNRGNILEFVRVP